MRKSARQLLAVAALAACAAQPVLASSLFDNLKEQAAGSLGGNASSGAASSSPSASGLGALGGAGALGSALGLPAIGGGTASNAAGVLQYCIKNKYLGNDAAGVKDKLMGKLGLGGSQAKQDDGYQQGLGGLLKGSDGTSFNLDSIKSNLKTKACDYVLDNASALL